MKLFLFVIFILWVAIFYLQQSIPTQPGAETVETPPQLERSAHKDEPKKAEVAQPKTAPVLTARRERMPARHSDDNAQEKYADPVLKEKRDRDEEQIHNLQFPNGRD